MKMRVSTVLVVFVGSHLHHSWCFSPHFRPSIQPPGAQHQRGILLQQSSASNAETVIISGDLSMETSNLTLQNTTEKSKINVPIMSDQQNNISKNDNNAYFLGFPVDSDADLNDGQKALADILREPIIEVATVFLVVISSFLVALSTVTSIDLQTVAYLIRIENMIAYGFAVEFFARWYAQFRWKGILQYLLHPLVLVDLVVVILPLIPLLFPPVSAGAYEFLPNWLFSSAGLVNLRLLRVLRIQRVLANMDTFADFQAALGIPRTEIKPYKLELARVVLSIFTLLSVSAGLIYSTEHTINPDIPSYFDALYFTLTTLTTVGFGDISPKSPEGKLVVCGSILAGVAVIPAQAAALVEALLKREEEKTEKIRSKKSNLIIQEYPCPRCKAIHHWTQAEYCWSCGKKLN